MNATNGAVTMGSPTNEIAMTQDGTQHNNVKSGGSYPVADVDAVQEVTDTLLGASAEYQQAQGGVMNLVNKSGTNQFRGDGTYYLAGQASVTSTCRRRTSEWGRTVRRSTSRRRRGSIRSPA